MHRWQSDIRESLHLKAAQISAAPQQGGELGAPATDFSFQFWADLRPNLDRYAAPQPGCRDPIDFSTDSGRTWSTVGASGAGGHKLIVSADKARVLQGRDVLSATLSQPFKDGWDWNRNWATSSVDDQPLLRLVKAPLERRFHCSGQGANGSVSPPEALEDPTEVRLHSQ